MSYTPNTKSFKASYTLFYKLELKLLSFPGIYSGGNMGIVRLSHRGK